MKKLIICLLITLTGLLGQNALAQSEKPTLTLPSSSGFVTLTYSNGDKKTGTELGVTKATQILNDICGVVKNSKGEWEYNYTGYWNKKYVAPSTTPGDVFFVEVNDFWMGVNSTRTNTLYDQINKGVKEITKVDTNSKKTTTTGTFYTHPAENVNKFFFIVRRSGTSPRSEGTDYDRAFGWYDEWSYAQPYSGNNYYTGKDGYNHLEATWTTLMDGAPFPSPHNCTSSLETNHYIALDGKNPADREGHDFTAYLYVPKNTSENDPYVFFYAIKLNDVPDSDVKEKVEGTYDETEVNPYNVTLHWTTAFDKYKDHDVQKPTKYDGMRERYIIERWYGNDDDWELVTDTEHLDGDNVKDFTLKTYTDKTLKPFDAETAKFGYTVYYRITSVVEKLEDEDGNKIDPTRMSSTTSNFVTVVIPGSVPFKLTLDGEGTSVYDPVNNMNSFTNVIVSSDSKVDATIALTAGTKLGLYKVVKDSENKDVITGEPYVSTEVTAADVTNNVTLKDLANRLDNTDDGVQNGHFRHTMVVAGGDDNTAAYQLMMTLPNADADAIYSNVLRINNPKLQAAAVKAHRSGYPDHETCKDDKGGNEVFHNEITFAASTKTIGSGYHIYRDATEADKEPIMTLLYSPTGEGVDRFRVTKPAPAEGEPYVYYYPTDGMISITDLHEQNPIAIGETGELNESGNPAAWGYSVAAYDVNGNTYGSQLATAIYNGEIAELAVELSVDLRAFLVEKSNDFYVEARLTWNPSKSLLYSDAVPATDEAYDVYVSIEDTHNDDAKNDTPSTDGFVKWNDVSFNGESTATTFTDIYTSKRQMEEGRFTEADRQKMLEVLKSYKFYVKMKTTEGGIKNSAVVKPTAQAGANGIYTALGDIEAADMDVKVVNGVVEVNGVTGAIKVVNAAGALVAEAEGNGDVTEIAGLTTGVYVVTAPNVKPTKILIK